MGVYHVAIESIYEKYVSEEPPLNLHGIMRILDPPVKPEISCKHIQVQYPSTDDKRWALMWLWINLVILVY